MPNFITNSFSDIFDFLDSETQKARMERWVVWLAASGFVAHLLLIGLARTVPVLKEGLLSQLNLNFLHAVYTPFSFILFYEVVLLVLALPHSHTSAIAKQYEIISLIVIRRVFKDIGAFDDPTTWISQIDEAYMVLIDMLSAVAMFALVTLFLRLSKTVVHSKSKANLAEFLAIKKTVAVVLFAVLTALAMFTVSQWLVETWTVALSGIGEVGNLDYFFFPTFFEFMIFTDVLLLILSIPFFDRYEYVIRNSGFVISTVLLRFSLTTSKPYDVALGLIAMVYGICILIIFSYFTRMVSPTIVRPDSNDEH